MRRRHLGSRVDPTQVVSEAANNGKPGIRPRLTALRERSPSEGRLDCQMLFTAFFEEGKELGEELFGSIELKAEGTANHKVVGESLAQCVHATSPGQGRAIDRKASRSTFA
jgi:hypothetical protein